MTPKILALINLILTLSEVTEEIVKLKELARRFKNGDEPTVEEIEASMKDLDRTIEEFLFSPAEEYDNPANLDD